MLLTASKRWPRTPDTLIAIIAWLEQHGPVHLHRVYGFILDAFYWLGVRAALRKTGTDARLESLAEVMSNQ